MASPVGVPDRLKQNALPGPSWNTFSACLAVVLLVIHSNALRVLGFWKALWQRTSAFPYSPSPFSLSLILMSLHFELRLEFRDKPCGKRHRTQWETRQVLEGRSTCSWPVQQLLGTSSFQAPHYVKGGKTCPPSGVLLPHLCTRSGVRTLCLKAPL